MDRRRFMQCATAAGFAMPSIGEWMDPPAKAAVASAPWLIGMYVHEGWPYHRPYAARTWTFDDWRGYAEGLSRLGFNTIIIWPALEIMPDPLPSSDRSHLETTAKVVDMLRREFSLRIYITLCPNVVPYPEVATKYGFEERPLFASITLADPGDPEALHQIMRRYEDLLRPLRQMDGLVLIDSDPGGYPGSTNGQFAKLLRECRGLLDRLRPNIELVYWMHMGWEAFSRYEATGVFRWGDRAEAEQLLTRLKTLHLDPWRITIHTYHAPPNGTDLALAEKMGLASTALTFNYGALEAEPSFPLTNFGGDAAFQAGRRRAPGGVVANAQTHCMQLPNTFAFALGAQEKDAPTHDDYVQFANGLIPNHGAAIVAGWQALAGEDPTAMRSAATQLKAIGSGPLPQGPLSGLLFGSPQRFVEDLGLELELKSTMEDFITAATTKTDKAQVKKPLIVFVDVAEKYQRRTGYQCVWGWPRLDKALGSLRSQKIDAILTETDFVKDILANRGEKHPGNAYHNRYSDGLMQLEISTPRLIAAMRETADQM